MLQHLARALARVDAGWKGVKPAEWGGWDGGVPQQKNDVDCGLFVYFFARWLAQGVPPTPLPVDPQQLRSLIAEELCAHFFFFRSALAL